MKKDIEAAAPKKKFMTNKERKKNLSRMQRKVNPHTRVLIGCFSGRLRPRQPRGLVHFKGCSSSERNSGFRNRNTCSLKKHQHKETIC